MKKFLFGVLLIAMGLPVSILCYMNAANHPWDYNGVTGLMGSFLGTKMLTPFIVFTIVWIVGVVICWYEAYLRK